MRGAEVAEAAARSARVRLVAARSRDVACVKTDLLFQWTQSTNSAGSLSRLDADGRPPQPFVIAHGAESGKTPMVKSRPPL